MKKHLYGIFCALALSSFFVNQQVLAQETSSQSAGYLYQKITALENQLTEMTGALEQMAHRISQLEEQVKKVNFDASFRLNELEEKMQNLSNLSSSTIGSIQGQTSAPVQEKPSETAEVKKNKETEKKQEQTALTSATADPQKMYDDAYQSLVKTEYDTAQEKLAAFLKQFPEHSLAGNAQYWLGETYYVQGQYGQAAVQFAEGFKKYKTSIKGPDNLLKLGMSMQKLDKKKEACTAFRSLKKEFPKAPVSILQKAQDEAKKLKCP